jgi:ATP-dependent DNA helicase RecQ
MDTSKDILQKFFGYSEFRPGQLEIISSILNEENILAILPTGAGKSLCYQIPALMSKSFSIVVSPLIALMKDQVDALNTRENISAFINSSLDSRDSDKVISGLASGKIKILYVSPEKLTNSNFAERMKSLLPSYLFVDEAHCISEWGHNFRPSYRKIKEFINFIGIKNISAFTATATEDVRTDIIKQLELNNPKIFVRGFERDNLGLNVLHTTHKKEKCVDILKEKNQSAIIYTSTRKSTEEVADFLRLNKIDSVYYHAGLTSELRRMIQDDFLSGRINTIVSTNAFGMGIDKSDVRTIIHYNLPGTIENYYQEIGRAGRDGKESDIFLLYDEKDKLIQQYFISSGNPSRSQIENVYDTLYNCGNVALGSMPQKDIPLDANFFSLLENKGMNRGLIDSSLRVLEESGYLKFKSDLENKHFVQFLLEPSRLNSFLKNFTDNEAKDLILFLAREYGSTIFNSKIKINIQMLCGVLELSNHEIIIQLERLSSIGILAYEKPMLFPAVSLLQNRTLANEISLDMNRVENIAKHSKMKLERLIDYANTDSCRFKYLLEYFGQQNENYKCNKCDRCRGYVEAGSITLEYLEEILLQTIHEAKLPIKKKNVIEIVTGKTDLSSLKKFSTFGSGVHFKKEEIDKSLGNLERAYLITTINNVLTLSEKGLEQFSVLEELNQPVTSNEGYENDLRLFNLLRQIRKEAAEKFNQKPNLICPDEVMRAITKLKPSSHSELLNINGFNSRMFNKIGEDFLNTLKEFRSSEDLSNRLKNKNLPDNINQVLELVQKKYSLQDIASLTKLPEAIVSTQIETLIEAIPDLEIDSLFEKNELKLIYDKIDSGLTDLKRLRESLNNTISFAKLRIAAAKKRVS